MAVESEPVTVTAPTLEGMYIHDPANPDSTIRQFRYNNGNRRESRSIAGNQLRFAGRTFPVFEFGEHRDRSIDVTLTVPFGPDWEADLAYLDEVLQSGRAWVYRDNRGRLLFGATSEMTDSDEQYGTDVTLSITATNFDESVESRLVLTLTSSAPEGDS